MAYPVSYRPSGYQHSQQIQTSYNVYTTQYNQHYGCSAHAYSGMSDPSRQGTNTKASPATTHVQSRPFFPCLFEPCAENQVGFARKADLERHVKVTHDRASLELVSCQFPGCHRRGEYGFTRKDKMIDHMRDVHKVDIPKRQPNQRNSRSPS